MKINKAVVVLSALAQESRLAIFQLLSASGEGGLAAGAIAEALHIPSATLSFHLAQLSSAGLVHSHRAGRMIFYSVNYKRIKKLTSYLTENFPDKKEAAEKLDAFE